MKYKYYPVIFENGKYGLCEVSKSLFFFNKVRFVHPVVYHSGFGGSFYLSYEIGAFRFADCQLSYNELTGLYTKLFATNLKSSDLFKIYNGIMYSPDTDKPVLNCFSKEGGYIKV